MKRHGRERATGFLLAAAVAFLLAGCSGPEQKADLVIINGPDPQTLDPALATGLEDLRAVAALFEGLARNDPVTGGAIPSLAERWEISPDGRTYTFHLRPNLRWSDGAPLTTADVIYSWRRVLEPETASEYAGQLFYLTNGEAYATGKLKDFSRVGVHALDPLTLRVQLNNPTPFFADLCAFQTLAVVPRQTIEKYGDRWLRAHHLPSSGAYMLDEWKLNNRIRLRKNPLYWDAANTKSEVIDLLPINSPGTSLNLYETGQADIIWDREFLPSELMDVLRARPDFNTFPFLGTYFLRFNVTRPPFNDARVRKAFALAIDKRRIVERVTRGGEHAADCLVPEGTANSVRCEGLGYDPAEARRLLAEAGYPGGKGFPPFEYLFDVNGVHLKTAVELQSMWTEQLGIHAGLRQMEKQVYLAAQNHLDYDVSGSMWIGDYNDPNTFLDLFRADNGNNRTGWKNARYDGLMAQAGAEPDLGKRAQLLRDAETILVREEPPIAPLYYYVGLNYYNPAKIKGIHGNMIDAHPLNAIWKVAGP